MFVLRMRWSTLWLTILAFALFCGWTSTAHAANRYWVGTRNNSDRWESSANWSALPRGAGGASVPGSDDKAILSFSGNTVRLRSGVALHDLILTNRWTGSLLFGTGSMAISLTDFGGGSVRVGSGRVIGGNGVSPDFALPTLSIFGTYTQTGGIVSGFHNGSSVGFAITGDFTVRSVAGSRPSFTTTGSFLYAPINDSVIDIATSNTTFSITNFVVEDALSPGSSRVTFSGSNLYIPGSLDFNTGGILDLDMHNVPLSVGGDISLLGNNGADTTQLLLGNTLSLSGNILKIDNPRIKFTASGQTVRLNGSIQTLSGSFAFSGLTIASSVGTRIVRSNSTVSGNSTLTIATGSSLLLLGHKIYATGSTILNFGTLTQGTGSLIHRPTAFSVTDSSFSPTATVTITAGAGQLYLSLTDSDENTSGTSPDSLTASIVAANGDTETITLEETSNTSGVFRGAIATGTAPVVASNGSLQLNDASTSLTITFTDPEDALVSTATATLSVGTVSTTSSSSGGSSGGGGGGSRHITLERRKDDAASTPSVPTAAPRPIPIWQQRMCGRVEMRLTRFSATVRERVRARFEDRCGW